MGFLQGGLNCGVLSLCLFNSTFQDMGGNAETINISDKSVVRERMIFIKCCTLSPKMACEKDLVEQVNIYSCSKLNPFQNGPRTTASNTLHTLIDLIFHMASFCLGG